MAPARRSRSGARSLSGSDWEGSEKRSPSPPKYPPGTVITETRAHTSRVEERVRTLLEQRGIALRSPHRRVQAGLDSDKGYWPILTPDMLVEGHQIAIEVDPPGAPKGPDGHDVRRQADEHRNRLLADVGWATVRLRLGLGRGSAIGPHDVETDSMTATAAAVDALAEAVEDVVHGRPGQVRFIPKKSSPKRVSPVSRLGALGSHQYEDGWYVSWATDSGNKLRFVLLDGGENLYVNAGWDLEFVAHVGLDQVPRTEWRAALEAYFEANPDPKAATRFPWGDALFIGAPSIDERLKKFRISDESYAFTVNLPAIVGHTDTALTLDGRPVTELHPAAAQRGWRIATVDHRIAYGNVPYQQITLNRHGVVVASDAPA